MIAARLDENPEMAGATVPPAILPDPRSPSASDMETGEDEADDQDELLAVKSWLGKITAAKDKWEPDFKRMRECMEFYAGIQWEKQNPEVHSEDYIVNLTMQLISQEKARLYARNPQAEVIRREKLNYALWDGTVEMLQAAFQGVQQQQVTGIPDMLSQAVMQDFMHGKLMDRMLEGFGKTFRILYQHQVDSCKPEFKEQMKNVVLTALVCGVGYCIPSFVRQVRTDAPSSIDAPHSTIDQAKMLSVLQEKLANGEIDEDSVEAATMKSLAMAVGSSLSSGYGDEEMSERLEWDFPSPTSIIPDPNCRSLREWIAARWVAQEFYLPVDEVNAFFGLTGSRAIEPTAEQPRYEAADGTQVRIDGSRQDGSTLVRMVKLYRVWDYTQRSDLFVAEGHRFFVRAPETLAPCISGFWNIFALVFNQPVVDANHEDCRASIFPPSDVWLVMHPQKEWNRTRNALRDQRNANAPTYLVRKGILTPEDLDKIQNRQPNEVIELAGLPADMEPNKAISIMQVAAIDKNVYDTQPLEQDIQLGQGSQQADIGPAQPYTTATVGTIAEQNKQTTTGSKVDDLDCFLSRIARAGGELMVGDGQNGMSIDSVKEIVGNGAIWPTSPDDCKFFKQQVELGIKAASSGRPNQQQNVSKRQVLIPLLIQAGANPIAIIEDLAKVMDDNLDQVDIQKFFPMPGQAMMGLPGGQGMGMPQQPISSGQPPVQPTNGAPSPAGPSVSQGLGPVGGPPATPNPPPSGPLSQARALAAGNPVAGLGAPRY